MLEREEWSGVDIHGSMASLLPSNVTRAMHVFLHWRISKNTWIFPIGESLPSTRPGSWTLGSEWRQVGQILYLFMRVFTLTDTRDRLPYPRHQKSTATQLKFHRVVIYLYDNMGKSDFMNSNLFLYYNVDIPLFGTHLKPGNINNDFRRLSRIYG